MSANASATSTGYYFVQHYPHTVGDFRITEIRCNREREVPPVSVTDYDWRLGDTTVNLKIEVFDFPGLDHVKWIRYTVTIDGRPIEVKSVYREYSTAKSSEPLEINIGTDLGELELVRHDKGNGQWHTSASWEGQLLTPA